MSYHSHKPKPPYIQKQYYIAQCLVRMHMYTCTCMSCTYCIYKKRHTHTRAHIYIIPLAIRGGYWTPRFCRGPQGQVQKKSLLNQPLLSRLGSYFLQNQEPCTKEKSDKANSYVLQNQDPHMRKYQVNICWICF